jgi:hypothetical protein
MNAFYPASIYPQLNGKIYEDYLDYRIWDSADGSAKSCFLSYYYPQYRQYIKNLILENASFTGVDGITLDFCGHSKLFGYELTDISSRQAIITQLLSDIRSQLNTTFGQGQKKIWVRIPYKDYETCGFDPEEWIRQGLIDVLIPACEESEEFFDITPFVNMTSGTNIKLYAGITGTLGGRDFIKEDDVKALNGEDIDSGNKTVSRLQYLERAYDVYQAGVDGLYIFNDWYDKGIIGILGDKVKVEKWHYFDYYTEFINNPVFIDEP